MATQIDALPYFDKEVDIPGLRDQAKLEIENEMKNVPIVGLDDPRIPQDHEMFPHSTNLSTLLDSYSSQSSSKAIDAGKWQIPQLVEGEATEEEWKEAERRSRVGLGHMEVRNANVSLLQSFGPNAWLIRNHQLSSLATTLESTLNTHRELVVDLNRSRRVYQESQGTHLGALESRWQDLVTSTVQLEMAKKALKGEVEGLRRKKEGLERDMEEMEKEAERNGMS